METHNFLGSLLYYNNGNIEFALLEKIRKYMDEQNMKDIDISLNSVYLTVNSWNCYFEMKDDCIELTDYYKKYSDNVRQRFFDCMDENKKEYFWNIIESL